MAASPARPYMYGGIFFFLLATIFLISAAAVPRFGVVTIASQDVNNPLTGSELFGAFQVCVAVNFGFISTSQCGNVDGSCAFTIGTSPAITMPYCGTLNAFRGFLITSLILAGLALLAALAHTCQASPNPNVAHFTFVTALLSVVAAAISLVCWISWSGATGTYQLPGSSSDPTSVYTATYGHGASFYLLISALVAVILGLVVWLYGRVQQKGVAGDMAAAPHYHSAPAHYAGDVQLHQPLTQQ